MHAHPSSPIGTNLPLAAAANNVVARSHIALLGRDMLGLVCVRQLQDLLNPIVVEALARAGGVPERVSLPFARDLWERLFDGLLWPTTTVAGAGMVLDGSLGASLGSRWAGRRAPDVVVFGNARDGSDVLLSAAVRALGGPRGGLLGSNGINGGNGLNGFSGEPYFVAPALVMDLPNLFPVPGLGLDAMVAPSYFAAAHRSVLATASAAANAPPAHATRSALGESGKSDGSASGRGGGSSHSPDHRSGDVPVHVIPPGVNASAFDPAAVTPACGLGGAGGWPAAGWPSSLLQQPLLLQQQQQQQQQHHHHHPPHHKQHKQQFRCGGPSPRVGFMGRLAPEKSPGLFLATCAAVARAWPGASFVVVGDGPLRLPLEAFARRLGLEVSFVGGVYDQPTLASHLAAFDVLVTARVAGEQPRRHVPPPPYFQSSSPIMVCCIVCGLWSLCAGHWCFWSRSRRLR